MRTSYSTLATFRQCPQRYKFRYIDKLPETKTKEQIFGTFIHHCLQFMFRHDPIYPTLDQVLTHYRENFPREGWNESELAIYEKQGEAMLKSFYQRNAPWNFNVIDLESRFEVTIEDPARGTVHILTGIMDRIDKLPDGRYEIIDYKTQKRLPSQEKVERDLQLSIYAMGLAKRWPHIKPDQIKLSLQFLKHGETLSTTRTSEDFHKTESDTLETIHKIDDRVSANESFEPVVSPLCDFCAYKPICPAWKHLYKNVSLETINGDKISSLAKEYFSLKDNKRETERRLGEIAGLIMRYFTQESIERIFDGSGIISKRTIDRYSYDFEKIRGVLEPLGKWQDVLKADETRLRAILKELPEWAREEIKNARTLARSTTILTATKNKKTLL
ncbi:MAG: hypothetical protein A3H71_01265 [Candidatus Sungbacteria bacterium RIFCSPLOWO2_02_FULL_48_13b]|uniref:PD-(D/E)XK endonuclease-like domain-containing protein n=1 Tax=Candidatus Sungbacteria bacterium RIFCSPLOWO2_02_FULL_48_13b TaxID=1802283 RepID=A0A1G2LIR9_9BACT|nr:MAG: hypothetical protein A3H71_01265 [Candidatus Sungbacteria bacterium RIFCSPLOWO2_02_FULL_48_13b]